MEQMLETIMLDAEEANELLFKVKVEGSDPAPARVRLVCEAGEFGYVFNGHGTSEEGVVQFLLPVMKDKIKEGTYLSRIEVLIENRYFAPVQFQLGFKKTMTVVAEAITVQPRKAPPEVRVTAQPIIVAKPVSIPVQVTVQQPTQRPIVVAPIERSVAKPVAVVQPQKKTVDREAPPLAHVNAQQTLKERFHAVKEDDDDLAALFEDKSTLRDLARRVISKLPGGSKR